MVCGTKVLILKGVTTGFQEVQYVLVKVQYTK